MIANQEVKEGGRVQWQPPTPSHRCNRSRQQLVKPAMTDRQQQSKHTKSQLTLKSFG